MPVATTKWPPAGAPFRDMARDSNTGEPCARKSAIAAGTGAATSTSAPPVNSAARQRLATCSPVLEHGKEAVAGLGALGIRGTVGGQELIERRRIGGTVGSAQFAAVLMVAEHRGQGRKQSAFLCDGGRSVAELDVAGLLEFRKIGQRRGSRAESESYRTGCHRGCIGAHQGDAFGVLEANQRLGLAIGIGDGSCVGKLRTAGRLKGHRGAHHRGTGGIAQRNP